MAQPQPATDRAQMATTGFVTPTVNCYELATATDEMRCRARDFDFPQPARASKESLRLQLVARSGGLFWIGRGDLVLQLKGAEPEDAAAPSDITGRVTRAGMIPFGGGGSTRGIGPMPLPAPEIYQALLDQVPECTQPLGVLALDSAAAQDWPALGLPPPNDMVRALIEKSGCFTIRPVTSAQLVSLRDQARRIGSNDPRQTTTGEVDFVVTLGLAPPRETSTTPPPRNSQMGSMLQCAQAVRATLTLADFQNNTAYATASEGGAYCATGTSPSRLSGFSSPTYEYSATGHAATEAFVDAYSELIRITTRDRTSRGIPTFIYRTRVDTAFFSRPDGSAPLVAVLPARSIIKLLDGRVGEYVNVVDANKREGWIKENAIIPAPPLRPSSPPEN